MDAASRAELDALRRRAFGPGSDIDDDPVALARLIELEELARPQPASPAPEDDAAGPVRPPRRHRWAQRGTLLAVAAATAAIVAAVVLAQPPEEASPVATQSPSAGDHEYVFVADPRATTLLSIPRDGSFGGYIELRTESEPPPFPATAQLDWAVYLGEFFGWDVWIAGGTGNADDEHCILIRRDDDIRARCADAEGQRRGTLHVSLAEPDIPAEERPASMTEGDRIRFWWLDSGSIDVVLGPFAID